MGENGLADIGLPDANEAQAVFGNAGGIDEAVGDSEGSDGGREIAATAGPIDKILVDRA